MDVNPARKRRAKALKDFRKEKKLTQMELAALSGLTQSTISKIECGIVAWSIDNELIYFETLRLYSDPGFLNTNKLPDHGRFNCGGDYIYDK